MEIEQVSGNRAWATLSTYEGKTRFAQVFERAWIPLQFDSPIDCVKYLREHYNKAFTLSECESKVFGPDCNGPDGHLYSLFYYRITTDME